MSTKVVPCNLCQKKLSDRRSLKKHLMAVHKNAPVKTDYICGHCELEDKSLHVVWETELERHKTIDESEERRIGLSWMCSKMIVFQNDRAYAEHMRNEHGPPAWDVSREILWNTNASSWIFAIVKKIDASSTASLLSIIGRTISCLRFVRCRLKRRRKRASMIIAETQGRTSQLVILSTQWDYRLLDASKLWMKCKWMSSG